VIVDFAVKNYPGGARLIADWLMAPGDVNDAEAPHANTDRAIGKHAFIIGTAMCHCRAHSPDGGGIRSRVRAEFHYSSNSAHLKSLQASR
jgi:hypothetical protein